MSDDFVRAAGAVLWRRLSEELLQVALIHRPRYDDWSLPKGKAEGGESDINCAYREVLEETGYHSIFGPSLCDVVYEIEGIRKKVKYWSAEAVGDQGVIDPTEVDQVIWMTLEDAYGKLSVKSDKEVLKEFENIGADTNVLVLLRHAKAVERDQWEGDDGDRPLAHLGQLQAKKLLADYFPYAIKQIHTSDAIRCYESIEPIASALAIAPSFSSELSEYAFEKNKKAALEQIHDLMENDSNVLVCSHNPVIPYIVNKLIGKKLFKKMDHELLPGQSWILHHKDGVVFAIDFMPAPTV